MFNDGGLRHVDYGRAEKRNRVNFIGEVTVKVEVTGGDTSSLYHVAFETVLFVLCGPHIYRLFCFMIVSHSIIVSPPDI